MILYLFVTLFERRNRLMETLRTNGKHETIEKQVKDMENDIRRNIAYYSEGNKRKNLVRTLCWAK